MFCSTFLLGHIVLVTELTARPSTLLCTLRKGDNVLHITNTNTLYGRKTHEETVEWPGQGLVDPVLDSQ